MSNIHILRGNLIYFSILMFQFIITSLWNFFEHSWETNCPVFCGELVFAVEKIFSQQFSKLLCLIYCIIYKILNCLVQISCFTHTAELKNNLLKLQGNQIQHWTLRHLTPTSDAIHPLNWSLGLLLNQHQFWFQNLP